MGIGDWGLGIGPNPQSPIPNPKLVNEDWLKKNNNSLVLKLFKKKENDSKFSSVDGTININIKNENGKDIICNADEVENFLSLNKKK